MVSQSSTANAKAKAILVAPWGRWGQLLWSHSVATVPWLPGLSMWTGLPCHDIQWGVTVWGANVCAVDMFGMSYLELNWCGIVTAAGAARVAKPCSRCALPAFTFHQILWYLSYTLQQEEILQWTACWCL